jgi:PleD family two-component response regulator
MNYTSLSLRYPPRFMQVNNAKEALEELKRGRYELIICMPNMDNDDSFNLALQVKRKYSEDTICFCLQPFSKSVYPDT